MNHPKAENRQLKVVLIRQSFNNTITEEKAEELKKKAVETLNVIEEALKASFGRIPPEFEEVLQNLNQIDIRKAKAGYTVFYRYNITSRHMKYFKASYTEDMRIKGVTNVMEKVRR